MKQSLLSGVGIGLRSCHYTYIEQHYPPVPWFEVLADNYFLSGGASLHHLEKICAHYPITLHCVGMSLGSTDPLNHDYLQQLKFLAHRTQPLLISDHLSWTSLAGNYFHELFPLPYTEEAIHHVAKRIQQVQDFLGQAIMIENVSNYLSYQHSTLTEWEFLQAIAHEANCYILLDINNIYVSAKNNNFSAEEYLQGLTTNRIKQFHLAGFEQKENYLLDTHGTNISIDVWDLFRKAITKFGLLPTAIERDNDIPDFLQLQQEAFYAKEIMHGISS